MTHLKSKMAQAKYVKKKLNMATPAETKKIYLATEKVCKKKKK